MTTFWSSSLNQVIYCDTSDSLPEVWTLDGSKGDFSAFVYLSSLASDWRKEKGAPEDLMEKIRDLSRIDRIVSLIRDALAWPHCDFVKHVVIDVEEGLSTVSSVNLVTSRLLEAPLRKMGPVKKVAQESLEHGCLAVGAMLHDLNQLQFPLRRIFEAWAAAIRDHPGELRVSFKDLWQPVVDTGKLIEILRSSTGSDFKRAWNSVVFFSMDPSIRAEYIRAGHVLASALYPQGREEVRKYDQLHLEDAKYDQYDQYEDIIPERSRDAFARVRKQISSISDAVAEGKDGDARRFISEMMQDQLKYSSGSVYAVKSLCSVASFCRKIFREDIEGECLVAARKIDSTDRWTGVQYANWLKDRGQFEAAIDVLREILPFVPESETVAASSLADIYAAMEDWDRALEQYRSISGYQENLSVRHAMADVYRRKGDLAIAEQEYEWLLREGYDVNRVLVSLAECAKLRGKLDKACDLYEKALGAFRYWVAEDVIPALGYASVLNRNDDVSKALQVVEQVLKISPFAMQAHSFKARLLLRLDRYAEAISCLDGIRRQDGLEGWVRSYLHGVALIGAHEYAQAAARIQEASAQAVNQSDALSVIRMASALAAIHLGDVSRARAELTAVEIRGDELKKYMRAILKAHLATLEGDIEAGALLRKELEALSRDAGEVSQLVQLFVDQKFKDIARIEIELLLKIAA